MRLLFNSHAPALDYGHLSIGKVQTHSPATNRPHINFSQPSSRDALCDKSIGNVFSKVKRNKSSSAADQGRIPDGGRLLSQRKLLLNRSNPNLWDCGERGGEWWEERRRSGSQPSLLPPRASPAAPLSPARRRGRSHRSTTWCCGTFIKQLNKAHHFD